MNVETMCAYWRILDHDRFYSAYYFIFFDKFDGQAY